MMIKRSILACVLFAALVALMLPTGKSGATSGFITRSGSHLQLNGTNWRFSGANIHWLTQDDGQGNAWPSHARIDAALGNAVSMHANVVRFMPGTFGCATCLEPSLGNFQAGYFDDYDYTLMKASSLSLRVIIPFIDQNCYTEGCTATWETWYGKPADSFYTDLSIRAGFEAYIDHVLNHVNAYNGVTYKNDPTVLAWETGNETWKASIEWTNAIAAYVKTTEGAGSLVADGHEADNNCTFNTCLPAGMLAEPQVDLYTGHYYPHNTANMNTAANLAGAGGKVFYIGEYDWKSCSCADSLPTYLAAITANANASGDLYWQLYDYGFTGDTYTLHYPGDTVDMRTRVGNIISHAGSMW
jgi:hypothetical protein